MGEQDHLPALIRNFPDGRDWPLDASRIGDLSVLHRDVEVHPHEHALVVELGLIEGPQTRLEVLAAHITLLIATAVSTIRQENPHSLSYQDMTRTSVPSITFV